MASVIRYPLIILGGKGGVQLLINLMVMTLYVMWCMTMMLVLAWMYCTSGDSGGVCVALETVVTGRGGGDSS